jgi:hypothetical protein
MELSYIPPRLLLLPPLLLYTHTLGMHSLLHIFIRLPQAHMVLGMHILLHIFTLLLQAQMVLGMHTLLHIFTLLI